MKSGSIDRSAGRLRGAHAAHVASARTEQTQKTASVQSVQLTQQLSRQALNRLKERPRLIAELADSHRAVSSLMLAAELLKRIAKASISIRNLVRAGDYTPERFNQIDVHKRDIASAVNTQLFGRYILDSSFAPCTETGADIEFQVPGLDLVRERLTNEIVTLYINNKMIPLAFDRVASDHALFQQFALTFGFARMRLRLDDHNKLVVAMPDAQWRLWDLQTYISGQGGRYPQDVPITVAVQSEQATVERITMVDVHAADALSAIESVVERVNAMYQHCKAVLDAQRFRSEKMLEFCHSAAEDLGQTIKTLFAQDQRAAMNSIHRHYVGPNRENVVSLIKK